ncbi:MAG: hypothetical protein ACRCYO_11650 [Bacteroidia bacterium]
MIRFSRIGIVFLLLLYVVLGFFREFLFVNINEQMRVAYYHSKDSALASSMRFLEQYDYSTLYYSKFPLTLLFAILCCGLSCWVIYLLFRERSLVRFTIIAFVLVFVLGWLFFLLGYFSGNGAFGYTIARFLAGMTESPALLVVLMASYRLIAVRK